MYSSLVNTSTQSTTVAVTKYTQKKMVCEKLKAEISCYQGNQSFLSFKSFYHWYKLVNKE